MVCKYDVRYLSDETALLLGSAVVGAYALQHLMAPHSAYETYWAPSQPYSVATTQYNGLGALSMAATTASVARLPGNRTAKKMLLKVTGASWLVFGLADLYYSRTGVNNNGGISAAINVSLGSYFLFKGFQPVADGKKSG
jgi:hypothetical protein